MAELTARTMQVDELFASAFLIEAPPYQRSFVWTADEALQLLEDVASLQKSAEDVRDRGEYFLGAMVFVEREEPTAEPPPSRLWKKKRARPSTSQRLDVVDGLQRLTTLTILFCVLRDLAEAGGERVSPLLLAAIRAGDGTSANNRLSLGETQDRFFFDHVRSPGATLIAAATAGGTPAEKCMLEVRDQLVAELRKNYNAGRRRQLETVLLKQCVVAVLTAKDIDHAHHMFEVLNARGKRLARNDVLKAVLLGDLPPTAAAACTAKWKEAERRLGEGFEQLFSHVRAMYRRPNDKVIIADIKAITKEKGGAQAFIERVLAPAAGIFDSIVSADHVGQPQSAAIAQSLRYLGWHPFTDWIPPAMLWWLEQGSDAEGLARLLDKLDRLAFGIRILGIGGSKRVRRFGAVTAAIRNGENLDDPDGPLAFSRQELRAIQYNLRNLHERNALVAKHLLLRLGDVLAGSQQSGLLPADMTVEHVLPRKVSTNSEWRTWHPDPEDREVCTESLGNLLLVTKGQNDRAGNLDFARKLAIYFDTRDAPIPVVNESLRDRTEWKPHHVKAREAQLLELIARLWDFEPARARELEPVG